MDDFNFVDEAESATSGSPEKNVEVTGGITEDIRIEAKRLAESPEGLDIAAFQKKHKLHIINIDEILRG